MWGWLGRVIKGKYHPFKMDTENTTSDSKKLELIRDFVKAAIEIFRCHQTMTSGIIKRQDKNIILERARKYEKVVFAGNASFEGHKKTYIDIYEQFRREILETAAQDSWIKTNLVDISLSKTVGVKFSICYERALKIRDVLDQSKTGNANNDEEIECKYEYLYSDELMYRFLLVIQASLPPNNRDSKKLKNTIEILAERAGMNAESDSEETTKKKGSNANNLLDGIRNMFPGMNEDGRGDGNIDGNGFMDIIGGVFGNKELTGQIGNAVKNLDGVFNKTDGNTDDVINNIFDVIKPVLGSTLGTVTKNAPPPGVHVSAEAEAIAAQTQKDAREHVASMGIILDDK